MKIFFIIVGIAAVAGALVWLWFYTAPKVPSQTPSGVVSGPTLPVASSTVSGQQPIPNQLESAGTQPEIARSFLSQATGADRMTLEGTMVVSSYALQTWGDENMGGEALMQYDASKGWVLVSMGGGAWDVSSLVAIGVPEPIAEQLVASRQ